MPRFKRNIQQPMRQPLNPIEVSWLLDRLLSPAMTSCVAFISGPDPVQANPAASKNENRRLGEGGLDAPVSGTECILPLPARHVGQRGQRRTTAMHFSGDSGAAFASCRLMGFDSRNRFPTARQATASSSPAPCGAGTPVRRRRHRRAASAPYSRGPAARRRPARRAGPRRSEPRTRPEK